MPQVAAETAEACTVFESGEDQLVKHDGAETGQRNGQRVVRNSATPSSVSANRMKSTGIPNTRTGSITLTSMALDGCGFYSALFQCLQPAGDFADCDVGLLQQLAHGEEAVELAGEMPVGHGHAGFLEPRAYSAPSSRKGSAPAVSI